MEHLDQGKGRSVRDGFPSHSDTNGFKLIGNIISRSGPVESMNLIGFPEPLM